MASNERSETSSLHSLSVSNLLLEDQNRLHSKYFGKLFHGLNILRSKSDSSLDKIDYCRMTNPTMGCLYSILKEIIEIIHDPSKYMEGSQNSRSSMEPNKFYSSEAWIELMHNDEDTSSQQDLNNYDHLTCSAGNEGSFMQKKIEEAPSFGKFLQTMEKRKVDLSDSQEVEMQHDTASGSTEIRDTIFQKITKVEVYEDQIRNLLGRISELQSGLRPWDDGNQDLEGSEAAEIKTLEKEIEKLRQQRDHRMTAWHEELLSAAENGTELVRKRKENAGCDFAAQTTSVDDIQSELASHTQELQSQLDDRTKQLQDAEALLNVRTDELHRIQTQLDDRTNQIQQMAITFESQAAEIIQFKKENERLHRQIDQLNSRGFFQQTMLHEEPLSLPNFSNQSSNLQQTSKKMKELEENTKKLTEMNLQWQKYNQKRDTQIKKFEKEIEELKVQIRSFTVSNGEIFFTETQQERIDNHCQRIRRAAEQTCERLETALAEAQQQLSDCRQRMEEAEQRAAVAIQQKDEAVERTSELQRQVEELNRQATSLLQEAEELRAALVVATRRHNHQAPPDQRLVNSLKEKVRQYEQRYLNVSKEYQKVLHENTRLLAHLNERFSGSNQTMPSGIFSSVFNSRSTGENPSSLQSSRSTDRNQEETREEPADPYEDIEVDSPVVRSSTTRSSLSFQNRTRPK